MKTSRTIDGLLTDLIAEIIDNINDLKGETDLFANGQRLAYIECLEIIKGEIMGDEEKFGLDGDLEKKFGLMG